MFYSKLYKLAIKFAALSDEQYKAILRNPKALYFLDENNKLDEFYKSMPEVPLKEIEERIDSIAKAINKKKEKKSNKEMEDFIEINGDKQIPIDLLQQIKVNILGDESYSDEESYNYSKYIEDIKFADLLQAYLESPYYSERKINDFLDVYKGYNELLSNKESLNEREKMILEMFKINLVQLLINMMKSIFSKEVLEKDVNNNLIEANKIRKSDYFDFLIDSDFDSIDFDSIIKQKHKDVQNIEPSNTKIEFPNYKDESTIKTR